MEKSPTRPAPVPWASRADYDRWKSALRYYAGKGMTRPSGLCRRCGVEIRTDIKTQGFCEGCRRSPELPSFICAECGAVFDADRRNVNCERKFCSRRCAAREGGRRQASRQGKPAAERRKRWATPERKRIVAALRERDGDRCGICRRVIDFDLKHSNWGGAPNPRGVSIDHVVPWSESRDNSLPNLRLAHFRCNHMRGTGRGADQLALI